MRAPASDAKDAQVSDDRNAKTEFQTGGVREFFSSLVRSVVRDAVKLVLAFALGTGAGAIVCWYFGIPLVFSFLGGFLVLALALALTSDSWFS